MCYLPPAIGGGEDPRAVSAPGEQPVRAPQEAGDAVLPLPGAAGGRLRAGGQERGAPQGDRLLL